MLHQGTQEVTRAMRPLAAMVGSVVGRAPGLGTSSPLGPYPSGSPAEQ